MLPHEKIAKILRIDPALLQELDQKMVRISGQHNVIETLGNEIDSKVNAILEGAGLTRQSKAEDVYHYLIDLLYRTDLGLFEIFKRPSGQTASGLKTLFNFANEIVQPKKVWVLKKDKALELLYNNPPPKTLSAFGYASVDELLTNRDFIQVFCALRFMETKEWMHETFKNAYANLTPNDFEWRPIEVAVLDKEWLEVAEKFIQKKYHNVSHLKELGVVFVIPLKIDTPGETARVFTLLLHYLYEVQFYSALFLNFSHTKHFPQTFASLLRGDVPELKQPAGNELQWYIVQRYLAKDSPDHPLLTVPHVSPEAWHWTNAERALGRFSQRFPELDLSFWQNLSYVGDFFAAERQYQVYGRSPEQDNQILVSFDLVDNIMSLVQVKELAKYLYHQEEALWNRLFTGYFGEEKTAKIMVENFDRGIISLASS